MFILTVLDQRKSQFSRISHSYNKNPGKVGQILVDKKKRINTLVSWDFR